MITITIDGIDRSKNIDWSSLQIINRRNKADQCSFTIKKKGSKTFKPSLSKEIVIEDNGTKIFAGPIVSIVDKVVKRSMQVYDVKCMDYTRYLWRRRIPDTYANETVNTIIASLISTYFTEDSITGNNVSCPIEIDDIRFDYERGDECLERLVNYTNYNWYIDYDKDIHFFAGGDELAPFNLTGDSGDGDYGKFDYDSLEITKDDRKIKNVIYVKGGEYLGTSWTEVEEADGEKKTFRTPYKLKNIEVWIDTGGGYVEQDVGVDGFDTFVDHDCLYNFNEKSIKFETALAEGTLVKSIGDPRLPVITKISSSASQSTYGVYEDTIVDKRIQTKEAAKERAEAELNTYLATLEDASFRTKESGLKSGQQITANINDRGINNEIFIIESVTFKMRSYDSFYYDVKLISEESMGVIEFFQKIIRKIDSGIEFKADEQQNTIIDLIKSFNEEMTMNEAIIIAKVHHAFSESVSGGEQLRVGIDTPPTWVYGVYNPTSHSDTNKTCFFDRLNKYA